MTKRLIGIAAAVAFLSSACTDDGDESKTTTGGTGGASGSGGQAGAGGSAGGGGEPSCFGTASTDAKFGQVMGELRYRNEKDKIPGSAIAIVKDGKLVNLGVTGSKRLGVCDPITPDTLFRAGWITQTLTSVAALDAVEDGKLSLTKPITDVVAIPTLSVSKGNADDITLHHLLTRSSTYWQESIAPQTTYCTKLSDAFVSGKKNPVLWGTPGTMQWANVFDFQLAGLALETVDQKPFAQAVKQRVLDPLEMGGAFDTASIEASDHALGHVDSSSDGGLDADCRNRDPATGYHGSIRDLAKLAEVLTGGAPQVLDPATLQNMLSQHGPSFFTEVYEGYGLSGLIDRETLFVGNTYSEYPIPGFQAVMLVFKDHGLAVVALRNASYAPKEIWILLDAVARLYDGSIESGLGSLDEKTPTDLASLQSLEGIYKDELGFNGIQRTLEVKFDPTGKLGGTLSGGGTSQLVSFNAFVSADNFTLKEAGSSFTTYTTRFWRDASGNGSAVFIDPMGDSGPPFYRVPPP